MPHGLDTETTVYFYEQEFYVLSNFSAFQIGWKGAPFATSEHVYQWEKFAGQKAPIQAVIWAARSAHEAFTLAQHFSAFARPNWEKEKVEVMYKILCTKVEQHEYVKRKLLETGDRELIENSWRDSFWGIGPDGKGKNELGRLWQRIRFELRSKAERESDVEKATDMGIE